MEIDIAMNPVNQSGEPQPLETKPFFIYQVELSSYCNMQCTYCPHPGMRRNKGFMSEEVLAACLRRLKDQKASRIVLHHFGEPLLHPQLSERLEQVARAGLNMQLSSNSLLLDRCWNTLIEIPAEVTVMISVHRWVDGSEQDYLNAVDAWTNRAEGTNVKIIPAYNLKNGKYTFHRWALSSPQSWDVGLCPFIKDNLAVVLWNGDIASCCVDHEGVTAKRNILSEACDLHISTAWRSCQTCDVGRLMVGEKWR